MLFLLGINMAFAIDKSTLYEGARILEVKGKERQIDSIEGIVYKQIKSSTTIRALHLSMLVPRDDKLKPAIVYFPGGGFSSAAYNKFIQMRFALAKAGFIVAAAEYRVIPDTYPALIQDAKAAIRYLRQHAKEYGIDSSKIGVLGDSAGGYVAQMLGMSNDEKEFDVGDFLEQSSNVQAVATLYGISNLLSIGEGFSKEIQEVHSSNAVTEALLLHGAAFRDFKGASINSNPSKALAASPLGHVKGKKPPFLIMHGDSDTLVSPMQSKRLFDALKAKNSKVEYIVLKGANHGDEPWYQDEVINEVVRFFKQILGSATKQNIKIKDKNANL